MFSDIFRTSRYMRFVLALFSVLLLSAGCGKSPESSTNPAAPGFDYQNSDPKAIQIADEVMEAMGGREAWDASRYLVWNNFGKRLNIWDKQTGQIRVETRRSLILMNLHTREGRAWKDGHELTEPDDLKRATDYGYEAWLNDSYWMFAPFKLKDSGVTLKYVKEDTAYGGRMADVISLTFDQVGVTPNNRYLIYVDKESRLVTQWTYFMDREDEQPRFSTQWLNYQKYGRILLSDDRGPGPRKKHKNLAVLDELPASALESPEPYIQLIPAAAIDPPDSDSDQD